MLVFSGDPGTKNFAASFHVVENGKIRLLATGMLRNTITDLTKDVEQSSSLFIGEIDSLFEKYGTPDATCFERFQSRGNGGTLIECVNIMLGLLISRCRGLQPKIITAATWKNRLNAELDIIGQSLNDLYADNSLGKAASRKTMHELDSAFIGVYRIYDLEGSTPFSGFAGGALPYMSRFMASPNL
jgi:hypothetical protein